MLLPRLHHGVGQEISVLVLDVEAGVRGRSMQPKLYEFVGNGKGKRLALIRESWCRAPNIEKPEHAAPIPDTQRD